MLFIDEVSILLKAGNGGKGIVSWRREAHVENGGPNGGEGGKGGDVILIGDHNLSTLLDINNKKTIIAQNGENGGSDNSTGANGENTYIKVPLGTSIYVNDEQVYEIMFEKQQYIICHGGTGGKGNFFFKSSFNRAPTLHENGDIGEEKKITLKLKTIADIGLVGLPNAGKSTFITSVTNSKSKIGNYQFTTLTPILGIYDLYGKKIVIADIPGLIEGASIGKGLGINFLKHVERCKLLFHLISLDPEETYDIINDFETIRNELKQYSEVLYNKPFVVIGNKNDTTNSNENFNLLKDHLQDIPCFSISSLERKNISEVFQFVNSKYLDILSNEFHINEKIDEDRIIKPAKTESEIIKLRDGVWEVKSDYLNYWFNKIPLDTNDNIIRFNQKIESSEVEKQIIKLGGKLGDTLIINSTEFEIN